MKTVDVGLTDEQWHRAFEALIAGETVKGFALVLDGDGFYALALHIAGADETFMPLASPDGAPRLRPQ
jgi:hypothetical protein